MSDLEILHSVYKKFYSGLKKSQNYNSQNFLNNNLGDFTEAVLEDWRGDLFLVYSEFSTVQNSNCELLFVVTARHNQRFIENGVSYVPTKTRLGVLSNGDIITFDKVTTKSGQTFTGDVYLDSYSNTFTVKKTLYKSELFNDFACADDITSEQIESVAVELAQEIIELHEQKIFNV